MSKEYDLYLQEHKNNVKKGFEWIIHNLPSIIPNDINIGDLEWQICINHDLSKRDKEEYDAYDKYFYGGNRSYEVVQNFNIAWLRHIHKNKHHWQHWILINDEPNEGMIILDMPHEYIIEMICDWWAFSWSKGDLYEIFSWYDENKPNMILSKNTQQIVEEILKMIKEKLDEEGEADA